MGELGVVLSLFTALAVSYGLPTHHHHHNHHSRQHRHHSDDPTFVLKVEATIDECRIPSVIDIANDLTCREAVKAAMLADRQLPHCDGAMTSEMQDCIDAGIWRRTDKEDRNSTKWSSRVGRICCEREGMSQLCRVACRSSLFAPTLSAERKRNKVMKLCDNSGDGKDNNHDGHKTGDTAVVHCLNTVDSWLK